MIYTNKHKVDWESMGSILLCNPTYPQTDQYQFQQIVEQSTFLPAHVWLSTSGSTLPKWVGLSKESILISAQTVNQHLKSHSKDYWVNCLPDFHVGGLSIWARAYLSGASVLDYKKECATKWCEKKFFDYVEKKKGTLTSLVPAQIHDLVKLRRPSPSSLRAVLVGGGSLLESIYQQAIQLQWPLLPTYGLTECASQVATATLEGWKKEGPPQLKILPHMQVKVEENRLCFSGKALFSTYATCEKGQIKFSDPKNEGWFKSEDRGYMIQDHLILEGRQDQVIKIGGENVDLARLETLLQKLRLSYNYLFQVTLIASPDVRLGHVIHIVAENGDRIGVEKLVEQFQKHVLPFEKIRKIHVLSIFPRSPMGKILKKELSLQIFGRI